MEVVKQKGSKQSDYLFKFDEYVKGWEQFVYVDVKNNIPLITEIRWVKSNKDEEVELNSTIYRELPIGDVKERVSSYIAIESIDFKEGNKTITDLDYEDILELAYNYIHLYPVIETKWKEERNALVYVSYYLLELNSYFNYRKSDWLDYLQLDLHSRISKRLGISKSNSIQILNRLKEGGYLKSIDTTVSLIPTIKFVNSLLSIVSGPKKFYEKLDKAYWDAYQEFEGDIRVYWEDNYYDSYEHKNSFIVLGTEYYDDSEDEELAELKEEEFSELSFEDVCDILELLDLWSINDYIKNKYVISIDNSLSVKFQIDDNHLNEIRKSNKYKNDMELAMDEKLIDEIFKDLNIDNYFELKDIETKWAEQAEGKKVPEKKNQIIDEDEAPF